MKAVILAGGLGTRISEETIIKPKPMIEIGGKPIIWHIMKTYSHHGINDFIICLGYKGYIVKEYFSNYFLHTSNVTFDIVNNKMEVHSKHAEPWRVTLVDTGETTQIGGRIKRVLPFVASDEMFLLTYGDGLSDVNIQDEIAFHQAHGKLATVMATQPPGRFGALSMRNETSVMGFQEKPMGDGRYINGGYFVLSPKVGDYIENDATVWEREPLENLAKADQLEAWFHKGFWKPMDTLRDKRDLEDMWATGNAPWKVWE